MRITQTGTACSGRDVSALRDQWDTTVYFTHRCVSVCPMVGSGVGGLVDEYLYMIMCPSVSPSPVEAWQVLIIHSLTHLQIYHSIYPNIVSCLWRYKP